ncbi:hypothetical protein ACH4KU_18335 [Streptomyces althioticus]|uniref:hypothetical protein n=1 Tax=Streptomyces TaxID=1883 RepID=UPI0036AA003E
MRRLVAEQLDQVERARKGLPYWLGTMGIVVIALVVFGAFSGSLVSPLVFAAGVVALCFWVLWMRRRSLERLHRMRQVLQYK